MESRHSDLDTALGLIYRATTRPQSIHGVWRATRREKLRPAAVAAAARRMDSRVSIQEGTWDGGALDLGDETVFVALWRDASGNRREERFDASGDLALVHVAFGRKWELMDSGGRRKGQEPQARVSPVLPPWILAPLPVAALVRFDEHIAPGSIADRGTLTMHGSPLSDLPPLPLSLEIGGMDSLVIDVDTATGVLARVRGSVAGSDYLDIELLHLETHVGEISRADRFVSVLAREIQASLA